MVSEWKIVCSQQMAILCAWPLPQSFSSLFTLRNKTDCWELDPFGFRTEAMLLAFGFYWQREESLWRRWCIWFVGARENGRVFFPSLSLSLKRICSCLMLCRLHRYRRDNDSVMSVEQEIRCFICMCSCYAGQNVSLEEIKEWDFWHNSLKGEGGVAVSKRWV